MVQNAGLELFFKKLSNSPKNEFDGTSFVLELASPCAKEIENIFTRLWTASFRCPQPPLASKNAIRKPSAIPTCAQARMKLSL